MNDALRLYRDDGLLASALGEGAPMRWAGPLPLFVVALAPLAIVLGLARDAGLAAGLAVAWFVLIAGGSAVRPLAGRLDWLVPVQLRAAEYGSVVALTAFTDRRALPVAYAVLAAVAFHQYDIVYRLRHQHGSPPPEIARLGGGWELRMLGVYALARTGHLGAGLAVAAAWLGTLFAAEAFLSWSRAVEVDPGEEMPVEAGGD